MKIYIFLLSFLSFAGCSETPQVQSAPWLDQLKNEEFEESDKHNLMNKERRIVSI